MLADNFLWLKRCLLMRKFPFSRGISDFQQFRQETDDEKKSENTILTHCIVQQKISSANLMSSLYSNLSKD
jgi:hypothetical protein